MLRRHETTNVQLSHQKQSNLDSKNTSCIFLEYSKSKKVKFCFTPFQMSQSKQGSGWIGGRFGGPLWVWAVTGVSIPIIGSRWHHHSCDSLHGQDNCSLEFLFQTSLSFKAGFVTLSSEEKKKSPRKDRKKKNNYCCSTEGSVNIQSTSSAPQGRRRCDAESHVGTATFHFNEEESNDMMMVRF